MKKDSASNLLFTRLKVAGLLSFGPNGIDLPMQSLNVLIGANGSGKSNLIEVLALLRAAPSNLPAPIKEMGGVREWLWKDDRNGPPGEAEIEAFVTNPARNAAAPMGLRHLIRFREHGGRFEVADERVENESAYPGKRDAYFYYRYQEGRPVLQDFRDDQRRLKREQVRPEESILSQFKDPERYPVLARLENAYTGIRLYRSWSFGPAAPMRLPQSTHGRGDFLEDGGQNLALVLSKIRMRIGKDLNKFIRALYDGAEGLDYQIDAGTVQLFLTESGGRAIPATRLSDGTLRYLCLLAILLHPELPPLIVIEEPELGLHPDLINQVAELLKLAATRTQVIVTTHSRSLVSAFGDQPEAVVVCEKVGGQSRFERLESDRMQTWLKSYSLGELWSSGELGANRW